MASASPGDVADRAYLVDRYGYSEDPAQLKVGCCTLRAWATCYSVPAAHMQSIMCMLCTAGAAKRPHRATCHDRGR